MTDVEIGVLVDRRYKVLSRLGSGGMADVFLAEDEQLGRKVALKLLHRRFAADPGFVERFRREAQAAAGLQHPNVVSTYDRGAFEDTYYIAMEYLPGRTLKQLIRQEAPLEPVRAIDITVQILKAARFAHRRGVIHRDLKPHNVIVDDSDHAKVTDFGIARAGASDMTETGSIMGTAQYLSPEQAQGLAVREPSDLYAVAVVLYEMLTGRVPFDGESAVTIALKHVSEVPPPPRSLNPAIPPDLEQVVMWGLNKKPEDRPQDADQFISVLEQLRDAIEAGARGQETASMSAIAAGLYGPATAGLLAGSAEAASAYALAQEPAAEGQLNTYEGEVDGDQNGAGDGDEDTERSEHDGRRRLWPWLVGLVIVALLGGAGAAAYLLTRPTNVAVPPVVGYPVAEATTILANDNFQPSVIYETSTSPNGTVFAQNPIGGDRVKSGATVTLSVSQGPGQASVPQVQGLSESAARKAITEAGLKVAATDMESSSTIRKGDATRTDPTYGTQLTSGQDVTLYISSGPAPVPVPYVIGSSQGAAEAQLKLDGLQPSVVSQSTTDASQVGNVISQSPTATASVAPGTVVTITVGTASNTAQVPNVVGDTSAAANGTLQNAGFNASQTTQDVDKPNQDGIVIKQSPAPGTPAAKGSTVAITVGKYKAPVTKTTTTSHSSTKTTTTSTTTSTSTTTTSSTSPVTTPVNS